MEAKQLHPETTSILTFVMRTLKAHFGATLLPIVFRDPPTLLTPHWTDYRDAQTKLHTSYSAGGAVSRAQLFHQIQPHMAVLSRAPGGRLPYLLPERYEPETERYIVREIILDRVGSVLPRITQQ